MFPLYLRLSGDVQKCTERNALKKCEGMMFDNTKVLYMPTWSCKVLSKGSTQKC